MILHSKPPPHGPLETNRMLKQYNFSSNKTDEGITIITKMRSSVSDADQKPYL